MKSRRKLGRFLAGFTLALVSLGLVSLSAGSLNAQTSDFFSSTQTSDARAGSGTAGTNIATNNPGFNPCDAGTAITNGACIGAAAALLGADNIGTTTGGGNFQEAGPGAVTDNMFGKITLDGAGSHTTCGATVAAAAFNTVNLEDKLNCGNVRINPETQGMNIPVFPGTNSLNSVLTGNADQNADFCANGAGDCVDGVQIVAAHTGLNLVNAFEWNPGAATATCLTAGGAPATPVFCADQIMEQVTALGATSIGTLADPGPVGAGFGNEQVVRVEVRFEVLTSDTLTTMPTLFPVDISMLISDPDLTGGTGTGFSQAIGTVGGTGSPSFGAVADIGMTFIHDELEGADLDGDTFANENQEFTCGAAASGNFLVGCSNYPTGPSQTDGATLLTDTNPPFLP